MRGIVWGRTLVVKRDRQTRFPKAVPVSIMAVSARHEQPSKGMIGIAMRQRDSTLGVMLVLAALSISVAGCTASEPSTQSPTPPETMATPGHTSPIPTVRTFVLNEGQTRVNLNPAVASPGDIVVCDGMQLRVPEPGTHRGHSGKVWVSNALNGSVSMGCRTEVAWGHLYIGIAAG